MILVFTPSYQSSASKAVKVSDQTFSFIFSTENHLLVRTASSYDNDLVCKLSAIAKKPSDLIVRALFFSNKNERVFFSTIFR